MKGALIVLAMLVCGGRAARAQPSFELPEPSAPPPREVTEVGASPLYYRLPEKLVSGLSRSSIGAHTRWSQERDTSFTLDVLAGAAIRFGRDSKLGLWIEGGYSYVSSGEHLALLGVGPARRGRGVFGSTLAIVPHAVVGRVDGELGAGVRTSVIAGFELLSFELAHQVLAVGSQRVHETHVVVTFPFTAGAHE